MTAIAPQASELRPVGRDDDTFFAWLRHKEYSRLDRAGEAYLDFTGSALYSQSQIAAHASRLAHGVFGNPHSENGASRRSTAIIEEARRRVLEFLDAPGDEYAVCFTANTTAAIKLVAESFRFGPDAPLVLSSDNHNSMNGIREFARRRGAGVHYVPLDDDLRMPAADSLLQQVRGAAGLFGFAAQSNFSGVKHSLDLVNTARSLGFVVLLDAAAFLPANPLSLSSHPADFVVFSAYKILGYPAGVGALVARKEALAGLERPWFSGGTVEYASVQNERHLLRHGVEAFEDGTPAFLSIAALCDGLEFLAGIGVGRVARHVRRNTDRLLHGLGALRHANGQPVARVYGPAETNMRGGTIAFNVTSRDGGWIEFAAVVDRARDMGVCLRGGCFCNPGAAEAAFSFPADVMTRCLDDAAVDFTIDRLSGCLGPSIAVGAVRASVGIATNEADIDRALAVVSSFAA